MLQRLLHEESVKIHLDAPNREAALAELIASIPSTTLSSRKKSQILELILQRERFGTTAIGEGAAMPHCVSSGFEDPIFLLGISRKGIHYPSLDGQPVHVIFMGIFPENYLAQPERLQILRETEIVLRDRYLKERLKSSHSPEQAY